MVKTKSKNWRIYLIEFFMLFIAVSLGFMADNYREKLSERTKEREYIHSIIKDVEEDRVNIKELVNINNQRIFYFDSLLNICINFNGNNEDKLKLNQYLYQVLRHPEFFAPTELTMQQLKNAGGMRLIRSKEAINEIIRYDTKLKAISSQQLYYENYHNKAIEIGSRIFNLQKLIVAIKNPINELSAEDFELINKDELKLKEFGNSVTLYQGVIAYYVSLLNELDKLGEVLIQTLKYEYKLK